MTDKDPSRIPIADRQAWTPAQAAQVYSLDYEGLLWAIRNGEIETFRPPNREGNPGRRRISKAAMERWIRKHEE